MPTIPTINVNFYIAPDDANLDPESGGMEIWDVAAPDMQTMRRLNGSEEHGARFSGTQRRQAPRSFRTAPTGR